MNPNNAHNPWSPFSWQAYPVTQDVHYEDPQALESCLEQLEQSPPLVTEAEINHLKLLIHQAARGEVFILQGGDCSELLTDCSEIKIAKKLQILLQMGTILTRCFKKPIVRIGRIAGQYAKPRTVLEETIEGITLPAYRGDMINGYAFTKAERTPDPKRMLQAYQCAGLTLNYVRALASPFFTSHEALHLPYEAALTREITPGHFYNLSTHFPWIGVRTLRRDSAHVEYLRGIENPIGIKVGPSVNLDELMQIISILNPQNIFGKIVLVHRFGKQHIEKNLPLLLKKLLQKKINCTVICDPMHGNTELTNQGIKIRYFDDILDELHQAFRIHERYSIPLAGVHFEMTGDNVTECVDDVCDLKKENLDQIDMSLLDPRLNKKQSLEMAMKIVEWHEED